MSDETVKPTVTGQGHQPGDMTPRQMIERMLRVDHAGEYGAVRIYAGQQAVMKRRRRGRHKTNRAIATMARQEEAHKAAFDKLLVERRVRPTLLQPFWHVAGFALGAATALLGEKAAMACTVAVEDVIDRHYAEQIEQLGDDEKELRDTIASFRADELQHRDEAIKHGAEDTLGYPLLSAGIKAASRLAIWLSTRI